MKEVLTSFGYINKLDNSNSQLNFAEHGIGLKINALRLGKTCLILTRKNNQVSVGLLSQKFIQDAGVSFIVAPLVCYQVQLDGTFLPLTPYADKILSLIVEYTGTLFK